MLGLKHFMRANPCAPGLVCMMCRDGQVKHAALKRPVLDPQRAARAGFAVQAFYTGEGALGSLAKFAANFSPQLAEKIAEF